MNASANDRHRLHRHLEQLLGDEDAATLMEQLPPNEWDSLATKADLRELERRFTEHVDLRVKATVGESTRLLFFSMLASQATLVGMVLAAAQLH